MSARILACAFAAILCTSQLAHAQRSSSYTDRYGVLSDRNIFLKDRTKPSTQPTTQSSRSDPERALFLTGIVMEEDGFRAYIENQNVGTIARLAVGEKVGRGRIAAIEIDAIAYEANGHTTWIELGHDLTNRPITARGEMPVAVSAAPTTGPAGAATPENLNPNDPNLTVEQRMKLRRMQETRGR